MYDSISMQILQAMQKLFSVLPDDLKTNKVNEKLLFTDQLIIKNKKKQREYVILTASGNDPSLPSNDCIEPPGTNSSKIFSVFSSCTVPIYL